MSGTAFPVALNWPSLSSTRSPRRSCEYGEAMFCDDDEIEHRLGRTRQAGADRSRHDPGEGARFVSERKSGNSRINPVS